MIPPIFQIFADDSSVADIFGAPVRIYPFGEATQPVTKKPYAVWQIIGGSPENSMGDVPDADSFSIQLDVYAESVSDALSAAKILRDTVEPHAHVVAYGPTVKDHDTGLYRYCFDIDFKIRR